MTRSLVKVTDLSRNVRCMISRIGNKSLCFGDTGQEILLFRSSRPSVFVPPHELNPSCLLRARYSEALTSIRDLKLQGHDTILFRSYPGLNHMDLPQEWSDLGDWLDAVLQ